MKIVPEKDLDPGLADIENPARYLGGEYGGVHKLQADFRVAVCYPDLYEIGMSNQAVAILYGLINSLDGVACERVFAPAEDFEALLREKDIPLYGLESGTPLNRFDLVAFTLSYELCATNVLTVLETGGIPLRNHRRGPEDPIVIAGGPAATNPLPYGAFIDAVFIGEAEGELPALILRLAEEKKKGRSREFLLECIKKNTHFWYSGIREPARRAVWDSFSGSVSPGVFFPVPSVRTVQDHGVVEIMRGCPHGCRFCHAGILYRPYRVKEPARIAEETEILVHRKGYREITLSSLSSGDYPDLTGLVRHFNSLHKGDGVSFSLPSLHLETFGLSLLSEISSTRKSGLTFAVETPDPGFQRALNKQAGAEKIIAVLREAKSLGWRSAKLYFMIGLPFDQDYDEAGEIAAFVASLHEATGFRLHVNLGTFIPKPHTPYQWSFQLTEAQALEKIQTLKRLLSRHPGIKISYHSPFRSFLEGVIARGDGRVGELIIDAHRRGARFDSWEDRPSAGVWRAVLAEAPWDVESATCAPRHPDEPLPWQDQVRLGVSTRFFREELRKHGEQALTGACDDPCDHACGICGPRRKPVDGSRFPPWPVSEGEGEAGSGSGPVPPPDGAPAAGSGAAEKGGGDPAPDAAGFLLPAGAGDKRTFHRVLCRFAKTGKAAYLPHLGLLSVMERSLLRAGYRPRFTEGFNPKPVMEFAQPLPVGMPSEDEVFSFDSETPVNPDRVREKINPALPQGLRVGAVEVLSYREGEKKPRSLMSRYAGGAYIVSFRTEEDLEDILPKLKEIPGLGIRERNACELRVVHAAGGNGRGFVSLFREFVGPLATGAYQVRKTETFLE